MAVEDYISPERARKVAAALRALCPAISIFAGFAASWLETALGPVGLSHDTIAGAMVEVITFSVTSIITYVATSNLAVWLERTLGRLPRPPVPERLP